jgi:hypothetical protein
MLGGNSPITIWNRWDAQGTRFQRFVITERCRYTQKTAKLVSGAGDTSSAALLVSVVVRIPAVPQYRSQYEWENMPDAERESTFTIQADDYIAMGIHDLDVGDGIPVTTLRDRLGSVVIQVKAINYSLHTVLGKHIRVEGV